jgi:transposase-like protein
MSKQRRRFNADIKFRVALEAAKGQQTISELAGKHSLGYPQGANQISQWKGQLLEEGPDVFARNGSQDQQAQAVIQSELYEQIGRLKMELAPRGYALKKKAAQFS